MAVNYTVHSQNLTSNIRNLISGFFPELPDPVFSREKIVGEVGGGQIFAHFIGHVKVSYFIYKLKLWHDVADAKSVEN